MTGPSVKGSVKGMPSSMISVQEGILLEMKVLGDRMIEDEVWTRGRNLPVPPACIASRISGVEAAVG